MNHELAKRLTAAAESYSGNSFLVGRGCNLSYGEAWSTIRSMADLLELAGLGGRFCGILAERSAFGYLATVATLVAGKAYVPLNPSLPVTRLRRVVQAARLDSVFVGTGLEQKLGEVLAGENNVELVLAENDDGKTPRTNRLTSARSGCERGEGGSEEIAYLLFTSGSTGTPKGVAVSQRSVCDYLDAVIELFDYGPEDVHSQTFELSFDLSVHDMLCAWTTGGAVVPIRGPSLLAPQRLIVEREITCWFSVPSVALLMERQRALTENAFPSLRVSLFCGEALPAALAGSWLRAAPGSSVHNLYGPTEATIAITHHRFEGNASQARRGLVPIGVPFPNQETELIEPETRRRLQPGLGRGELVLAGSQLTAGYFEDAEQSRQSFLHNVFGDQHTWYRTGDLCERDELGLLHYVGRLDSQVKYNGYRVELAEIEAAIRQTCGIDQVAVIAWPREMHQVKGLAAVVADTDVAAARIRAELVDVLPAYMIPTTIRIWDKLPVNLNGKVDKGLIEKMIAGTE